MKDYEPGVWGFSLVWGIEASVIPRAFVLAFPNAALAYFLALNLESLIDLIDHAK